MDHEAVELRVDACARDAGERGGAGFVEKPRNLDALHLGHDEEEGRDEEQSDAGEEADEAVLVTLAVGRAAAVAAGIMVRGEPASIFFCSQSFAIYFGVEIILSVIKRWDQPFGQPPSTDSTSAS